MDFEELKIEIEKLKKECPDFFEKIDPSFLEFITSENFLITLAQICHDNKITDEEQIEKITSRVILALFGEIPEENLAQIFELGVSLDPQTAKKIHLELRRLIFSQFKEPKKKPEATTRIPQEPDEKRRIEEVEKPKRDIYREPIE